VVIWRDAGDAAPEGAFETAWHESHGSFLAFELDLTWEDRWILSALEACARDTNEAWNGWRLNDGASRVYDFFWHDFCDWYLELAKIRLYGEGDTRTVRSVLLFVLGESLKLLHPLMPYVTEEIWDMLPMTSGLLLENSFPREDRRLSDPTVDERMSLFREIVTATRNIRAQYHVNPGARTPLRIKTPPGDDGARATIEAVAGGIVHLARVGELEVGPDVEKEKGSASSPIGDIEVVVPLSGVVDLDAEYERLAKEKTKIEKELEAVGRKLSNEKFVNRAKADVVAKEREKEQRLRSELDKLAESMSIIKAD
jgi:valyl-tRNA synthetase